MAILFVAELHRLKMHFYAFNCIVFVQALVRLNNYFKFPLCACVAAVDTSFLCHLHLFIDHLYHGTLSTVFLE